MESPAAKSPYAGHRFPAAVISQAVWLYFRFPLGLRMVEEMLAARGIVVSHETIRQWALKFGQEFAETVQKLGALRCRAERPAGPPLCGDMVVGEGAVRDGDADLQHAMGASR
jgi:hypothetical protein